MKTQILFFLLFGLFFSVNGQVWIDSGAVWHYDYSNVGYGGFYKYEYTKDTVIENHNCQLIVGKTYSFTRNENNELVQLGTSSLGEHYTYVNGDTVFFWNPNENRFFTLFNFGSQTGDTWIIATEQSGGEIDPENDSDTSRIEVIQSGNIEINAQSYRYIKIKPTYGSTYGMEGTYVERWGNIDSTIAPYQYLFPSFYDYSGTLMAEWDLIQFKCYEDASLPTINPSNEDCEYYLSVLSTNTISDKPIHLYPNPTSGKINLSNPFDQSVTFRIFDQQGRMLSDYLINPLEDKTIDISAYENGIYFVETNGPTGVHQTDKIVKR